MTRRIRFGCCLAAALVLGAPATRAQFPGQYIPPTRVPETAEPPLAPRDKAGELPDFMKRSAIGEAAPGVTAVAPAPVSADPPTPAVSIHFSAPSSTSAGADLEYKILVENKSQAAAHHVKVTYPVPPGVQVLQTEPAAADEATPTLLTWKIGTLKPGESRTVRVSVRPVKEGLEAIEATARVHFEHGQKVRTVLHRPQIAIRKMTNQHALEKQEIACKLIVENTGAVELLNIEVNDVLGEGLTLVEKGQNKGPLAQWKLPALGPKQSKEFTYTVVATKPGKLTSKIEAKAERGAKAEHEWKIDVGPSPLSVTMTGPKQVYLNYPARYDIEVAYAGAQALDNVVLAFSLPKGMKVVRATPGSQSFGDRLQWAVQRLAPREKRTYSVWGQMSVAGTVPNFAQVLWRGPAQRAEVVTEFLGAAALHLDVRESNDPVRVGDKVRYTLTVSNRGSAATRDARLLVQFPVTQFALDSDGSDGKALPSNVQEIDLPPVPPKGQVTKTVTLKATAAGRAVFHVEMESSDLPSGNVTREEQTTITD